MMKVAPFFIIVFTFVLLSSVAEATLIDFGERGNTQKITEPSFKEQFMSSLKDFNATEKKEEFLLSINKVGDGTLNLPECDNNTSHEVYVGKTLLRDYFTPDGRLIAKKGTSLNPLSKFVGTKQPMIVIFDSASSNQVDYIKSICAEQKCILAINKGNSFDMEKKYNMQAFPLPGPMGDVLQARCSLSVYDMDGDHYRVTELNLRKQSEKK